MKITLWFKDEDYENRIRPAISKFENAIYRKDTGELCLKNRVEISRDIRKLINKIVKQYEIDNLKTSIPDLDEVLEIE